jgi:alkylation response protein AidB-like acyl-CoA dehydrogenase
MTHMPILEADTPAERDLLPYLDDAQREWRRTVFRQVARIAPPDYVRACDEQKRFPEEAVAAMAEAGYFAVTLPEQHGGIGGFLEMAALVEMLGYHAVALARHWNVTCNMVGGAIARFATPEIQAEILPQVADGRISLAFALSEPESGSDAASLRTIAELDGEDVVITGEKMWITGAMQARYILTACRTDRAASRHDGISLFLVPAGAPGLVVAPIDMLGGHAIRTCSVTLNRVRVPARLMVGTLHKGWAQLMSVLSKERIALAAICVGAAQAACDEAIGYARTRRQFGRPIGAFQAVAHKLVEIQTRVDAARLMTYRAARLLADGVPCTRESSQAKAFASDAYLAAAIEGLQVLGANGYTAESALQRHLREAKLFQIFGGTNEIQRNITARELGLGGS